MTLYLIGIGLNKKGYSREAYDAIKKVDKIFLDSYTVEFPYDKGDLEKQFDKKIIFVDRDFVENLEIIEEARKIDIALLVYGSPLMATTHITLVQEAKKRKVKFKIIYSASILDAIAETGLQLYKFGKIVSMPIWNEDKNFRPDSFMDIIRDNRKINAHSLILVDINLDFQDALKQLEIVAKNKNVKIEKIVLCSRLGNEDSKIFYDKIERLRNKDIKEPFCIIIPEELHFIEEEILSLYS